MRFSAPSRASVDDAHLSSPPFQALAAFRHLLSGPSWPDIEQLQRELAPIRHRVTESVLTLVADDALNPAENYEQRIFHSGQIATRRANWHDLFNALAWKGFPALKSELNAGQVADMARVGLHERTRRQCAYTQFDEAGAIAYVSDPELVRCWDRHDWTGLFLRHRQAWSDGRIRLRVFGHALFEHALNPGMLLVSKTVVVSGDASEVQVADAIAAGQCLQDPQDLRPLPMAGIPGWHARQQDAAFFRELPCFRPLRAGRRYPAPLSLLNAPGAASAHAYYPGIA